MNWGSCIMPNTNTNIGFHLLYHLRVEVSAKATIRSSSTLNFFFANSTQFGQKHFAGKINQ